MVAGVDPLGVGGQEGRNPNNNNGFNNNNNQGLRSSCCCAPISTTSICPNPRNQDNLGDLINPRLKPNETEEEETAPRIDEFVVTRIVNNVRTLCFERLHMRIDILHA